MDDRSDLHGHVEGEVLALLERAPAYRELSDATRAQLAADMTKVGAFLADKDWLTDPSPDAGARADGLPALDSLRGLAKEVDFPRFVSSLVKGVFQAIVDTSIQQMQDYAELLASVSQQLDKLTDDTDDTDDTRAASSAREPVRQRQQQLATMVLMGINRIVVTSGRSKR
jgi:hypothetical protein